ncbi:unnamed protein product [Protopolystoma xenopodis]|uniref:Uncharacterized protein n=1 Tax=Protopolystoma xenopodis TaxID=117903 RepID=A0A448WSB4_9PLAT|nr:unnamed protein product [Protopolystoma xenopodis]
MEGQDVHPGQTVTGLSHRYCEEVGGLMRTTRKSDHQSLMYILSVCSGHHDGHVQAYTKASPTVAIAWHVVPHFPHGCAQRLSPACACAIPASVVNISFAVCCCCQCCCELAARRCTASMFGVGRGREEGTDETKVDEQGNQTVRPFRKPSGSILPVAQVMLASGLTVAPAAGARVAVVTGVTSHAIHFFRQACYLSIPFISYPLNWHGLCSPRLDLFPRQTELIRCCMNVSDTTLSCVDRLLTPVRPLSLGPNWTPKLPPHCILTPAKYGSDNRTSSARVSLFRGSSRACQPCTEADQLALAGNKHYEGLCRPACTLPQSQTGLPRSGTLSQPAHRTLGSE